MFRIKHDRVGDELVLVGTVAKTSPYANESFICIQLGSQSDGWILGVACPLVSGPTQRGNTLAALVAAAWFLLFGSSTLSEGHLLAHAKLVL